MIQRIETFPALPLFALTAALGCAPSANLRPAQSSQVVAQNVAETQAAGVVVRARGDVWPGNSGVLEYVTPMQVWIENRGAEPVQLRYSEMSLQGSDGRSYRALPPWTINGLVEVNVSVEQAGPRTSGGVPDRPRGAYYAYSNVDAQPPLSIRSLPYWDHLYENWTAEVPLPTPDMTQMALPEALVQPQGAVSGFVYFEPVPRDQQAKLTLKVDVLNPDTNAVLGKAEIPFRRH